MVPACIYGCLRFVLGLLVLRLHGNRDRDVELLLLRHELSILRRTVKRPRLDPADRMILVALAKWCREARGVDCWSGRKRCWVGIGPWSAGSGLRSGAAVVRVDLESMESAGSSSSDLRERIPAGAACAFEAS